MENYIHYDSHLKHMRASREQDKKMAKRIVKKEEMKRMKRKEKRLVTELDEGNGENGQ